MNLASFQSIWVPKINAQLTQDLKVSVKNPDLHEVMNYAVMNGGKRLRPLLTLAVIDSFGRNPERYLTEANVLELIHAYSLIHDDLPAMDDDDMRRGKPTTHIVYGEAMAILAADALQPLAYEWINESSVLSDFQKNQLTLGLTKASGPNGMVGGQVLDMIYTGQDEITLSAAESVHRLKTGALIRYALVAGGILVDANQVTLNALDDFGSAFGFAFQIKDDLDDLAQDDDESKQAYPTLLGVQGAQDALAEQVGLARDALAVVRYNSHANVALLESFLEYFKPALEKQWV
ncbi:polyprenyl synthetase family protein [Weissella tructae]|uniref:Farnesyl diphosphate synthase n=2 Tax=Weissella TaxID=46255 RepID=A0A075U6U6_9LACO|nr:MULTISPECIES: polyprenyl synthetase family protein [Weissella]AIG65842.1 Geranyltranstransferase [Weissella tructae]AIM63221.1 Geranyltranstransferase [Weissella ceti]AIM64556.2 Geranyltranstransferase [Weissella ceti]ELA07213.1 polyprenyl synthetase [Weissella ceti NC36]QVV91001.1 polyprenyl synthetase family protein [Weissella tructae]